jgi:hypothetical protein
MVSNSEDWRDTSLVIAYSSFQGQDAHAVTDYSEALVIADTLPGNTSHTVFESGNPVWDGYEGKLENEGFEDVDTRDISWEESQYELYSDVSDQVEGFVVIKPGYGIDTISILPKVVSSNYWPIYYDGESTEQFLRSEDRDTIFYGEYLKQPWKKLDLNSTLVAEGSKKANNRKLTSAMLRQQGSDTLVVAGDSYIEEEFVRRGDPILVNPSVQEASDVVTSHDVSVAQVIGAENVGFGTDLENSVQDLTVIAKFGRRFTGQNNLDSTYPIKKIPVTPHVREVSVEDVRYDEKSSVIEVVFRNSGTAPTEVEMSAISVQGGDQSEVVSRPTSIKIKPEKNTTVDFESNLSFSPETASVSFNYEGADNSRDASVQVASVDETSVSDLELSSFYYLEPREQIVMEFKNTGDTDVWTGGQIKNLDIMNRTVNAISEDQKMIEAGSTARLTVDAYLTEAQIEENSVLNLAATYGESENFLEDDEEFNNIELSVKQRTLTGIAVTYGVPLIIILIIILVVLYLRRRRKMKKELRGLK